tara:strand:+ start:31 stop:243 length:213 start_codon:yes stop_codon:yes gene_type:complete
MEKGDNDLELVIEKLNKRVKELEDINKGSTYRIADLENINESHRQLNGELRDRIKRLEHLLQEYVDNQFC